MRAYTYEAGLLKIQFDQRQGIFACGGYDVFSSQARATQRGSWMDLKYVLLFQARSHGCGFAR